MCKYCNGNESLFYDRYSKDVREVVIEGDGSLSIFSNNYDREDSEKSESMGFTAEEARNMAQYRYNIKINYCPMCGRKLEVN